MTGQEPREWQAFLFQEPATLRRKSWDMEKYLKPLPLETPGLEHTCEASQAFYTDGSHSFQRILPLLNHSDTKGKWQRRAEDKSFPFKEGEGGFRGSGRDAYLPA